eukprot:comp21276_c0_seq1/m.29029 comp21276_c0_seq1/g.29029  ORF comp21276_c0_seq1/g.29029 comp21276_c0_seq1/m.29029 type:complete len:369 (-) comp21276_c0_seq1:370-1476(-)
MISFSRTFIHHRASLSVPRFSIFLLHRRPFHHTPAMADFTELPIFDISSLYHTVPGLLHQQREDVKATVQEIDFACAHVGFFYIKGHGLSEEEKNAVFKVGKQFFDLPMEEKMKISILKSNSYKGYQRLGENVTKLKKDWHEAIDFARGVPSDDPRAQSEGLFGPNLWPEKPENFQATFEKYVEDLKVIGWTVMRGMALALGLESDWFMQNHILTDPHWVMRLIGYPPLQSATGVEDVGVSCGEHTDYGFLTILNQDQTQGALQVQNVKGDWANANPIPGAFVVNIGDMISVMTSGRYKSTLHRVVNRRTNYRISVPFFMEPNSDAVISPLPGIGEAAVGFKPMIYGDHLLSKFRSNFQLQPASVGSN